MKTPLIYSSINVFSKSNTFCIRFIFFFLLVLVKASKGQSVLNLKGALVYTNQTALVHVNGSINYVAGNLLHDGTLELNGNWANNAADKNNEAFDITSQGIVRLDGGAQEIQGYNTTNFPSLSLEGYDTKRLIVSIKVNHELYLNNIELDVKGNEVFVLNTSPDAIKRSTGYVNTSDAPSGRLLRKVNANTNYEFPLGGGADFRYRPLTVNPSENGTVATQFQNYDPNNDGYNRMKIFDKGYNDINERFYHGVEVMDGVKKASITLPYNSDKDGGIYNGLANWQGAPEHWVNAGETENVAEAGEATDQAMHYHLSGAGKYILGLIDTTGGMPPIFITSAFTPNHDGKNDYFVIKGLEQYRSSELRVYNRWGNLVYTSPDYHNDWDGYGLDMATYMYLLKVRDSNGKERILKGDVTLLR